MIRLRGKHLICAALVLLSATNCSRPSAGRQLAFKQPAQGVEALKRAVINRDRGEVLKILGPEAEDLVSSGDAVADARARDKLAQALSERTELATVALEESGYPKLEYAQLIVGTREWPFPIPLVKENGQWRFDTAAGREEILRQRIGENELKAVSMCGGFVEAQRLYHSAVRLGNSRRQYAQKFISTPGKQDGLYWESMPEEAHSPLGPLLIQAAAEGYTPLKAGDPKPYHGYFFRILAGQGPNAPGGAKSYVVKEAMTAGFAMIAYPARYGGSGIATFIVGPDGAVFQKDLGENTADAAARITSYDPDAGWLPVTTY